MTYKEYDNFRYYSVLDSCDVPGNLLFNTKLRFKILLLDERHLECPDYNVSCMFNHNGTNKLLIDNEIWCPFGVSVELIKSILNDCRRDCDLNSIRGFAGQSRDYQLFYFLEEHKGFN